MLCTTVKMCESITDWFHNMSTNDINNVTTTSNAGHNGIEEDFHHHDHDGFSDQVKKTNHFSFLISLIYTAFIFAGLYCMFVHICIFHENLCHGQCLGNRICIDFCIQPDENITFCNFYCIKQFKTFLRIVEVFFSLFNY